MVSETADRWDATMAPNTTAMAQMLATAVHTFRALVTTIQGTGDPNEQLSKMVGSMGDMATIFEQFATVATVNDSTMQHVSQSVDQMQQQVNGQATINQQLFTGECFILSRRRLK